MSERFNDLFRGVFVATPIRQRGGRPLGDVSSGLIELKLFASIIAIAAIFLLERFINVHRLTADRHEHWSEPWRG